MDGGGAADSLPPLTVFLHKEHYQSLQPVAGLGVQDKVGLRVMDRVGLGVKDRKLGVSDSELEVQDSELEVQDSEMEVQDSDLEVQDSELEVQDSELEEQDSELEVQDSELDEQDSDMEVQDSELEEQDSELEVQDNELEVQDSEMEVQDSELEVQDSELEEQDSELEEQDSELDVQDSKIDEQDSEVEGQDSELDVKDSKLEVQDSKLEVQDSKLEVQDSKLEVQDSELEVQDSELEVQDSQLAINHPLMPENFLAGLNETDIILKRTTEGFSESVTNPRTSREENSSTEVEGLSSLPDAVKDILKGAGVEVNLDEENNKHEPQDEKVMDSSKCDSMSTRYKLQKLRKPIKRTYVERNTEEFEERITRNKNDPLSLEKYCKICGIEKMLPNHKKHNNIHHKVSSLFIYPCPLCWEWFPTEDNMRNHTQNHRPGDGAHIYCKVCKAKIKAQTSGSTSGCTRSSYKIKKSCPISIGQQSLDEHMKIHSNEARTKCGYCGKKCKDYKSYQHHVNYHHENKHNCKICGAAFARAKLVEEHVKVVHSKELVFQCDQCGKTCPSSRGLASHMKSHSEFRPFHCKICSKTFK